MKNKSDMRRRIAQVRFALDALERGLDGQPYCLGENQARHSLQILKSLGFNLVTRPDIVRDGRELRPKAKPVLLRDYIGFKHSTALFELNVQTTPKEPQSEDEK